jgi:FtsP/CotA-like multicopper oxidase with cupredoxin domain
MPDVSAQPDASAGSSRWSRRRFLAAGLALSIVPIAGAARAGLELRQAARIIRARTGQVRLRGRDKAPTTIWGFEGTVPGPTLRCRRGDEIAVRLVNELPEPTAVHWHGLRIANAMDGVPHLTQPPIQPGEGFDYRFAPPDAGTFWYHSHLYSSEQLERGLYGLVIVDEPNPVAIDQDVALVLDDWRLNPDGSLDEASFRSMHDAAHAGRIGEHITVNSAPPVLDIALRRHDRVRLRLINVANARIFALRIDGLRPFVMAIDGQPADPFVAPGAMLGPGNRIDLFVDATGEPGSAVPLLAETERGTVTLARLLHQDGPSARARPLPEPHPLPDNPLPATLDLADALRLDLPLDGGAMSMMMRGMMGRRGAEIPGHGIDPRARLWTMAGLASSGHDGPPLFSVARGRTVVITIGNRTHFPHAMHLHGHHFRLLDDRGEGWRPFWLDAAVVPAMTAWRIAFVADNPGKWMLHCHMLEHQETGMAAWFEVV